MLFLITNSNTDKRLVEISLSVLRSIFQHPFTPIVEINTNTIIVKRIIGNVDLLSSAEHHENNYHFLLIQVLHRPTTQFNVNRALQTF